MASRTPFTLSQEADMIQFQLDMEQLQRVAAQSEPGLIEGKRIADEILTQVRSGVELLVNRHHTRPKLAVIQVEGDPASSIYVRHKVRACERVGIESELHLMAQTCSANELHDKLDALNQDPDVCGILLQLPLPVHLSSDVFIRQIDPSKDVDGLHPDNLGALMAWSGSLEPCTPRGCMRLLEAYRVQLRGARALMVGRSSLVGRPMAQMLMRADATVTVAHRHTHHLPELVGQADVLVVATGVPHLIKGDWVKPGAVVLDVGTSRVEDNKLVGDVDFDGARQRAALISPVPGGVGPMTVATLMENTLRAAWMRLR